MNDNEPKSYCDMVVTLNEHLYDYRSLILGCKTDFNVFFLSILICIYEFMQKYSKKNIDKIVLN